MLNAFGCVIIGALAIVGGLWWCITTPDDEKLPTRGDEK